ncbi:PQQ-dependent sugar dehydrogenase [Altererythrobacter sp. KTW20L]|uniref:PQQ-dependent sugar dehydrogenase n=1 Tax=Altererythrobacter sp. KTW20L TaxID=2942210 RepID=UPI0020BE0040|nr:PQQ-dependent sugar dehydrogenase [Altererythrobacter sp. KTW20L]MCL6249555.1 PQQ-dependent sugar dehydrogenase [Altererythrobacter sp. KTW20L]
MSHKVLSSALFPIALMTASCGAAQVGDSASTPTPRSATAVELDAAVPFTAEAHLDLAEGWAVAVEPGTGNLLITEKAGTAKYYNPATGEVLEVSGLPTVAYGGQGGLGDVAFAPDYASTGMVYLSWAQAAEDNARRAVAARGRLECSTSACAITGLNEIWRQEPAVNSPGHFSHKFAFSPDGQHLFIASGDRMQADPAQDNSNTLGTIVRLNLDGSPAAGNPFADQPSPTNQIWSYGHRNIYGLEFDAGGQLWDVEHGPRGGDELNMVEPGNNYGWPDRSFGVNYNGDPIPDHSADDGFVKPAIFWTPVIAPGGMIFYRGNMFADWRGQLLIANLGTQTLVRLSTDAATGTATEEARYAFPRRLRDIEQAADGSLWVVEDGGNGRLLRLTPR